MKYKKVSSILALMVFLIVLAFLLCLQFGVIVVLPAMLVTKILGVPLLAAIYIWIAFIIVVKISLLSIKHVIKPFAYEIDRFKYRTCGKIIYFINNAGAIALYTCIYVNFYRNMPVLQDGYKLLSYLMIFILKILIIGIISMLINDKIFKKLRFNKSKAVVDVDFVINEISDETDYESFEYLKPCDS